MSTLNRYTLLRHRDKAISWLLSQQREDGCLEADFGFRHGKAESWPTALFVNAMPVELDKERARARDFLLTQQIDHSAYGLAWGYNFRTPPDADTTLESLQALQSEPDRDRLFRLRQPQGGFATYTAADASAVYTGRGVTGWTSSHLEITANMLRLAKQMAEVDPAWREVEGRVTADLIDHVRRYDYRAYWYHSPIVAAAMVLKALGGYRADLPPIPLPKRQAELSWELRNNPHIMAAGIEAALMYDPVEYKEVITYLAQRLIRAQREDGSWLSTLVLSVPYPEMKDPNWVQHINADYGKPTVTALTVVSALNRLIAA